MIYFDLQTLAVTVGCLTLDTNLLLENMYVFIIKNTNTESFPIYTVFLFLTLFSITILLVKCSEISCKLYEKDFNLIRLIFFILNYSHSIHETRQPSELDTFLPVFSIVCISMLSTFIHNTQNKNSSLCLDAVLERLFFWGAVRI